MTRARSTALGFALVLVGLPAAGAAPALGATDVSLVTGGPGVLQLTDLANGNNVITVSQDGTTITVTDTGAGASTTDADCATVNASTITCPLDPADPAPPAPPNGPVQQIVMTLANGTDSFTNQNLEGFIQENDTSATGNKTVAGGPAQTFAQTGSGDDTITGSPKTDFALTGAGNDTITLNGGVDIAFAGFGNDVVDTGDGNDQIAEDPVSDGADILNGGPGSDFAGYGGNDPVSVTLNGQADDGRAGEGDNVMVENITGSNAGDVLVGDDLDNTIQGAGGDDLITAAGGRDTIFPGAGSDAVDGGDGSDRVDGGSAADAGDTLNGAAGVDDQVSYCCGLDPVTIAQDGQPNDGRVGEGDNLAGFESFIGGDGPDTITADAPQSLLDGQAGNDVLVALGAGGNRLLGGVGDDTLVANQPTRVANDFDCDVGFDTVAAGAPDLVSTNCERQGATIASESAKVSSKGKASLLVDCPAAEGAPCAGKLALLSNGKQVGKGSFKATNGKTKKATAKLTKKGRKALSESGGALLVTAEARTNEPPGVSTRAATVQLISG